MSETCIDCGDTLGPDEIGWEIEYCPRCAGMPDISDEHAKRILARPMPSPLRLPPDVEAIW